MTDFIKTTEQESNYKNLEKMTVMELITSINKEDMGVPIAVQKALPQIEALITAATAQIVSGGRLFYLGAGTSGRLGILDASEIPPTYGMPKDVIIGLIAGGEVAIRNSVEEAEDSFSRGWEELKEHEINDKDFVVGIAASGTTPYVLGALESCKKNGIPTGCITCNIGTPLSKVSEYPVEVVVGPEFVTGSTRMKSGTAQKLVLNMISTTVMIQLGKVENNRMVNMQLNNSKLLDRGIKMIMLRKGITDYNKAHELLIQHGSVKKAIDA